MRGRALLLAGALLWARPAAADFFQDLGFALDKLGDSVGDAIDDVTGSSKHSTPPPSASASAPAPAGSSLTIHWNPAPAGVVTRDMDAATTALPPLPRSRPQGSGSSYEIGERRQTADDAPPPHRAPARYPVQMVAALAPLPGFSEAPARPHPAPYSPAAAAATLATPALPQTVMIAPPRTKPAVAADRPFAIQFRNRSHTLNDRILRDNAPQPDNETKSLLSDIVHTLTSSPDQRLKLEAQAIVLDDRLGEARRRSFERAQMVQEWLEHAGVRPTQIDLDVQGAGDLDAIRLSVYKAD